MNWKRILAYLLGIGTLGSTPMLLLEYGDGIWANPKKESLALDGPKKSTEVPFDKESPVLADSLEADLWDDIFKTSDLEGEKATQPAKRYQQSNGQNQTQQPAPKGGLRVGCICMDEWRQEQKGRGACAGHGGVRYWLYKMPNNELLKHPTKRHAMHPNALNSEELKQVESHHPNITSNPYQAPRKEEMLPDKTLAKPKEIPLAEVASEQEALAEDGKVRSTESKGIPLSQREPQQTKTAEQMGHLGFYDLIVILIICITVAFVTHTLFLRR